LTSITIERAARTFGNVRAVDDVSLAIRDGEFFTLLGPSGCGKTTLLRMVAGFGALDSGRILFGEQRVDVLPPHKRNTGMVFQNYAVFPHLRIGDNVAYGLRARKVPEKEIAARVARALKLIQLDGYESRWPHQLSGGQLQRVAIARAVVIEPHVLLLDEPLSNLDAKLREDTRVEVRELVKRLGITTVYVTHDQLEALTMSDVVAVMDQGHIVQEASPTEIYRAPKERFVANFIGLTNFLEGHVTHAPNGAGPHGSIGMVETKSGILSCIVPSTAKVGDAVTVVVRPEDIALNTGNSQPGDNLLEGRVAAALFMGEAMEYQVELPGSAVMRLKLHASNQVTRGDTIRMQIPPGQCRALMG
jgi:ABC-type Fe3+/spermidine/putrescine transport system ATPase subunit